MESFFVNILKLETFINNNQNKMFFKYPKRTFRLNIDPYIPIDDIVKITNDIPRFDYEQENLTKVKTY